MRRVSRTLMLFLLALTAASLAYAVGARGRVVDGNGTAKDLVKVDFGTVEGAEPEATAWTDDYGYFSVDVPAGTYQVTVSDGEEGGEQTVLPVTVDAGGTMEPSTLKVDW